jgi:hypothetical protein
MRQDDHGNQFEVERFSSRGDADERLDALTSGYPHHQHYWIRQQSDNAEHRSTGSGE